MTPNRDLMLDAIATTLSEISTNAPCLANRTDDDKIYEIYILSLVVIALRHIGAEVEARDCYDKSTQSLNLRIGPGFIYSPSSHPGFIYFK